MTDIPEETVERGAQAIRTKRQWWGTQEPSDDDYQLARAAYAALTLPDLRALAGPEYAVVPRKVTEEEIQVAVSGLRYHWPARDIVLAVREAMLAKAEEQDDG